MFNSLLKAAVGVVVLPVAIATDIIAMPVDAVDGEDFGTRTSYVGRKIAKNIKKTIE